MIGRRQGLPRPAVRARQRHARAQADPEGVRRRGDLHRPDGRVRRRDPARPRRCTPRTRTLYFYPDQYNNPANWRAHYDTTGPELLEQTSGRITHFVSGLGTSGTFMGTGRRLREAKPDVKLISVQPDSPLHGLEGLKHMATAIVPGIYDPALADEDLGVSTEDAFRLTRELARQGLFVGISSGANLAGALDVARRTSDAVIVVIFCDGGEKYLSERFWDETGGGGAADGAAPRAWRGRVDPRSTASKPIPTNAAARCTAATASCRPRSRCRTPPKRARDAGFSCARRTTARPRRGRARSAPSCSGSTTRTPTTPRGRRSTTSTTRGRSSRTSSCPSEAGVPEDMTSWRLQEDRSAFDQEDLTHA